MIHHSDAKTPEGRGADPEEARDEKPAAGSIVPRAMGADPFECYDRLGRYVGPPRKEVEP